MTHFSAFNQMSASLKQDVLLRYGNYMTERSEGLYQVMLYEMDQFYVEVYKAWNSTIPQFFRSFKGEDGLEPYILKIDLNNLLSSVL